MSGSSRYASASHHFTRTTAWEPDLPAERVNDHILMSRSNSYSYVVTSDDGDVVINTGAQFQGQRHRERFESLLQRPLDVRTIIFTQSHPDHTGGWSSFNSAGVETIAQASFPEGRLDRTRLREYFHPRSKRIVGRKNRYDRAEVKRAFFEPREPEVTTLFDDSYSFDVGGRRFELYSVPGGETRDGVAVWLPGERTAFVGNVMGALYGALPHLSTIRGDRPRSARQFIASIERILGLEPELLITGHDQPIEGAARIRADLRKVVDAVRYIHDRTVEGMNAGRSLWDLMADVELPAHLRPAPGRGPVRWYVRAVWEEYAGWFRGESTTELYATPPRAIWGALCELAGGCDVLAERAAEHVRLGRAVEALHFTDISLSVEPSHRASRAAQIAALELLIEATNGETFDDLAWLESELTIAREALSD